jgi:alpha-galactosidase
MPRPRFLLVCALCSATLSSRAPAASPPLAPIPPMGWNSWDSYGLTVNETDFLANARSMAQHLKRFGWQYAVVDEGWYLANPEAKPGQFRFTLAPDGRFLPAPNRFPSATAASGFKPLAATVHDLGLKFGVHIIRGIPREAVVKNLKIAGSSLTAAQAADQSDTCRWNADNYGVRANAAGQAYYDSLARLYAGWGVDFVKVDCITVPYKDDEIRMFSDALKKTGRPIVLSLSPGPTPLTKLDHLRAHAQLWRISDDVWDHWAQWPGANWSQGLLAQFKTAAAWAPYVEPGHWPDADMLPIGRLAPRPGDGKERNSAFTPDEARTLLTLSSIFRSPLFMGGNLTLLDDTTSALLTNEEVLAVDQHSSGGHPVVNDNSKAVWVAKGEGKFYVALFNLSDSPQTITYPLQPLGVGASSAIRDLWQHKDLGRVDTLKAPLAPHAAALYSVK